MRTDIHVAHQQPKWRSRLLILLIFNILLSTLDSLIDSLITPASGIWLAVNGSGDTQAPKSIDLG